LGVVQRTATRINQSRAFRCWATFSNGQTTFALPDLRGRTPIHVGDGHVRGERGGEEAHTLTLAELPAHTHAGSASLSPGDDPDPTGNLLASPLNLSYRAPDAAQTSLAPATVAIVGGSQAHENMQPFLALNFSIALVGIFPSRTITIE
jgi:microcystin-dependent protein